VKRVTQPRATPDNPELTYRLAERIAILADSHIPNPEAVARQQIAEAEKRERERGTNVEMPWVNRTGT
jgi:hypothetical protein